MPAVSPQRKRTTPAASSSAGWSLCAGSSTSSTSPCPKRSGSSRSSQTESTSTGCASAAGWPPGTPHFPPLDPTPHPPRIHPYSPPSHSTQALLRLPQPLAQPRAHPLPRLDDDDRRPRGEPPPWPTLAPHPYLTSTRPKALPLTRARRACAWSPSSSPTRCVVTKSPEAPPPPDPRPAPTAHAPPRQVMFLAGLTSAICLAPARWYIFGIAVATGPSQCQPNASPIRNAAQFQPQPQPQPPASAPAPAPAAPERHLAAAPASAPASD